MHLGAQFRGEKEVEIDTAPDGPAGRARKMWHVPQFAPAPSENGRFGTNVTRATLVPHDRLPESGHRKWAQLWKIRSSVRDDFR